MATGQTNSKVDMSLLWREFPQFKDATVCTDQDTKMASVLDVLQLILESNEAAKKSWQRIQLSEDYKQLEEKMGTLCPQVRINGTGKLTPVAPFRTLLEIIYLLPGKRAHDFRKTSAQYMARLLSGDLLLIEEIEARYDASTPEEREFFRNGTDDNPDRKRRRKELEGERRLRLRREEAVVRDLEADVRAKEIANRVREMESLAAYRAMLGDFGLDRDPRMRMLLNDTVANMLVPTADRRAIEAWDSALADYVTVGKFLVDRGITDRSSSALGRQLARAWRDQEGGEPEETLKMVQGDMRPVKVYPVRFLEKHVLGWQ